MAGNPALRNFIGKPLYPEACDSDIDVSSMDPASNAQTYIETILKLEGGALLGPHPAPLTLIGCLVEIDAGIYRGRSPQTRFNPRVYGGQFCAQALAAAYKTITNNFRVQGARTRRACGYPPSQRPCTYRYIRCTATFCSLATPRNP